MLTLDQLTHGQAADVLEVTGDDAIAQRLMEMGVIEGSRMELIGAAPWGDPLEFSLRGYRLSLRKNEARRVHVELAPSV